MKPTKESFKVGIKITLARDISIYFEHFKPGEVLTVTRVSDTHAFSVSGCMGCARKGFDRCLGSFGQWQNFDIVQELTNEEIAKAATIDKSFNLNNLDNLFSG